MPDEHKELCIAIAKLEKPGLIIVDTNVGLFWKTEHKTPRLNPIPRYLTDAAETVRMLALNLQVDEEKFMVSVAKAHLETLLDESQGDGETWQDRGSVRFTAHVKELFRGLTKSEEGKKCGGADQR